MLLAAGVVLGFSRSPRGHFKILGSVPSALKDIERRYLVRTVKEFYEHRLVSYTDGPDGATRVVITEKGKTIALRFDIDAMRIPAPERWDERWRVVIFDIPERRKRAREALREKLKALGFKELQKSVFLHPYPCEDEINFIAEFFHIRPHVRLLLVDSFTNEEEMVLKFGLY